MENNEVQLRKQLSIIQKERQQWLILEQNYKQTIKRMREEKSELMNELERMEEEIRILSSIYK